MAELGDIFKEWDKLNTPGKIAVGGAAVAVALIALAVTHKSASQGGSLQGNTPDTIASGIVSGLQQAIGNGTISTGAGTGTGTVTGNPITTPAPTPAPTPSPAPAPAPTPAPPTWTKPVTTYRVVPGDWLSKIVSEHPAWHITWQQLYAANMGVIGGNPNLIKPGQVLTIPGQ